MAQDTSLIAKICEDLGTAQTTQPINMKRFSERMAGGKEAVFDIRRAGTAGTAAIYGVDLANPWKGNNAPAGAVPAGSLQTLTAVFRGDGTTQVFDATNIPYVALSNLNWQIDLDQFDRFPYTMNQSGIYAGTTFAADSGSGTNITFPTETFSGDGTTTAFTTKTLGTFLNGQATSFPPARASGYLTPTVAIGGTVQAASAYTWSVVAGFAVITFAVAPTSGSSNITIAWAPAAGMEFGVSYVTPITIWAAAAQQFAQFTNRSYDRLWAVLASSPSKTSIYVDPRGKG